MHCIWKCLTDIGGDISNSIQIYSILVYNSVEPRPTCRVLTMSSSVSSSSTMSCGSTGLSTGDPPSPPPPLSSQPPRPPPPRLLSLSSPCTFSLLSTSVVSRLPPGRVSDEDGGCGGGSWLRPRGELSVEGAGGMREFRDLTRGEPLMTCSGFFPILLSKLSNLT